MLHSHPTDPAATPASFFSHLFEVFTPRSVCMRSEPDVIWLHVGSDVLITAAYWSIPIALYYFVRRRKDLAFDWMFVLFALFIFLCGTTHLFGVLAIWKPFYRVDGLVKLLTGGVSIITAVLLWRLIPKALALPSPSEIRLVNERLQAQIEERRLAEARVAELASNLEKRVEERTAELADRNQALRVQMDAREAAEKERNELLVREQAARGEAERLNHHKDQFLMTLSHELRTPLNAIFGWAQVLREDRISEADRSQGLEVIERNARAQARMIEDLLDTSRVVAGKLPLDLRHVDLAPIIEAAVKSVRPTAKAKGLTLVSTIDPGTGFVHGDPTRLQQIVWNLLSNAIKFTDQGGQVDIVLLRQGTDAMLRVADTGRGMDAAFLPLVFDRFRQADATTTRLFGGLGLGLSLVRHLVELHGGSVVAQSPGEGKGSTFTVRMPLSQQEKHQATEISGGAGHANLSGLQILVVEDEVDSRDLLRRILERAGASAITASSATEALGVIAKEQPDILVCDIGMPDVDGYELMRRIREDEGLGRLPALALTALARPEDRRRAFQAGFDLYISKPFEPDDLLAAVMSLAKRRVA